MDPTSKEVEKLTQECNEAIDKLNAKMEIEIRSVQQVYKKELEEESNYLRNMMEIESGKLREHYEQLINKINSERYKDLHTTENVTDPEVIREMIEKNRANREMELQKEQEAFELESKQRRCRFEAQLQRLNALTGCHEEYKRIDFLKKETVPILIARGFNKIADEAAMDRYRIKITRSAICTGQSWALYKATFQEKAAACRVVVLAKLPLELRRRLASETSARCMRFLCESTTYLSHVNFPKLYEIFASEQKLYYIMDEYPSTNIHSMIYKEGGAQMLPHIHRWIHQLGDAFIHMHTYAIAHLNIRSENVIADNNQNIKVVGLSRTLLYFNLDQERIIKCPHLERAPYNDHLPPECFVDEFPVQPADMWSFGLLIYEMVARNNPVSFKIGSKPVSPSDNPFNFSKITEPSLRSIVERMLSFLILNRPKFSDLSKNDYFKPNG
ncbi:serine/threonine protein kinase [Blomia tropicalis]|nr:serine/threonine protein kinase [Blomia tropicalis]